MADGDMNVVAEAPLASKRSRKPLLAGAVALAVAAAGTAWLLAPRTHESTDNAYLEADSTAVAPRISGQVAAVLVRDNQPVHAGDPLLRIDSQDYDARLLAAQAAVADAHAQVMSARAALAALDPQEGLALAERRAASTAISAADAEYARASADSVRFRELGSRGFATRRDVERLNAAAVSAASLRDRTRADTQVAAARSAVVSARRPQLEADLAQAEAAALKARAGLTLARQERDYATIVAPIEGIIGNRRVRTGDYVQPGTQLLTIVPLTSLYVVANFKETQTREMRPGQRVSVKVDALGGSRLTGRIDSFAPGSGSEFTLLPFEPGSGNFTKIVQRVAVRIRLDANQPELRNLRPGLSVNAEVDLESSH
ncbi:HlyD family efflux transporter periplasmic adaptor subunit [Novosphingobium sp. Gsoil 351]|nr:HlyD family efflux transporter periplasmic adaptor subunit [Novosphingobium sp. Gsoil 351]